MAQRRAFCPSQPAGWQARLDASSWSASGMARLRLSEPNVVRAERNGFKPADPDAGITETAIVPN